MNYHWPSIRRKWDLVLASAPAVRPPRLTAPRLTAPIQQPPEPTAADLARMEAELDDGE